jgi:hypothetical protein
MYQDGATTTPLNPSRKSIARIAVDFHHRQLHPGKDSKLNDLTSALEQQIERRVTWEQIQAEPHYRVREAGKSVEISLLRFCGKILIEAATVSYFGEAFLEIEPRLLDLFYEFDEGMWKLLYNYPPFLCSDLHITKDRLVAMIAQHFSHSKAQRSDEAWFTQALEEEQRRIGLTEHEMASTVLIIYFAYVTIPPNPS